MGERLTDPTSEPAAEARAIGHVWEQWVQHGVLCGYCILDLSEEGEPATPGAGPHCRTGLQLQARLDGLSTSIAIHQHTQTYLAGWS